MVPFDVGKHVQELMKDFNTAIRATNARPIEGILPLSEAKQALAKAEETLNHFQNIEVALRTAKRHVRTRIQNLEFALGIGRLPQHILSRILFFGQTLQNGDFVYTVSLVSRSWRKLALQTPQLWTEYRMDWPPQRRELYAKRSAHHGLNLIMPAKLYGKISKSNRVWSAADIKHSSRWKKVTLELYNQVAKDVLSQLFSLTKLPLLVSLDITYAWNQKPVHLHTIEPSVFMPALRRLRLDSVPIAALKSITSTIVVLQISRSGYTAIQWLDLLRNCPRLESLHLEKDSANEEVATYQGPIVLPKLRQLVLQQTSESTMSFVLSYLRLPKLKSLNVHLRLGRSSLALTLAPLISPFFKDTPLLTDLEITNEGAWAQKILSALSMKRGPPNGKNILLPRLEHLTIDRGCNTPPMPIESDLRKFIEGRLAMNRQSYDGRRHALETLRVTRAFLLDEAWLRMRVGTLDARLYDADWSVPVAREDVFFT